MTLDLEQRLRRELDDVAELLLREAMEPFGPVVTGLVASPRRRAPWVLAAAAGVAAIVAAAALVRGEAGVTRTTTPATSPAIPATVAASSTSTPIGPSDAAAIADAANRSPDPGYPIDVIGSAGTRATFTVRSTPELVSYGFEIPGAAFIGVMFPARCTTSRTSGVQIVEGSTTGLANISRERAATASIVDVDGRTMTVERFVPPAGPFEYWSFSVPQPWTVGAALPTLTGESADIAGAC